MSWQNPELAKVKADSGFFFSNNVFILRILFKISDIFDLFIYVLYKYNIRKLKNKGDKICYY